jgi:hypothetical protein
MTRHSDWPVKLHQKLIEYKNTPYQSGVHDCILAACTFIEAITGTDPAVEFRGKYSTDLGAAKVVKAHSCQTLLELVESIAASHGMTPVPAQHHHRGDLVMLDEGLFGIVHLDGLHAVYVTTQGLAIKPLSAIRRIWRVPY